MSYETDSVRQSCIDSINYVVPYDSREEAVQAEVVEWIASGVPLTKRENPLQHLGAVAFVTTAETDKVFLINHLKAGADLMPGGHVDPGRTFQETIQDELAEELGVEVDMSTAMPFYIAKVLTTGSNAGHYDVTAVFKVVLDEDTEFTIQEKEADRARWFDRSELGAMQVFTLLPDIDRKLAIDKHILLDNGGVLSDHYCAPYHPELADMLGVDEKTLKSLLSEKSEQGRAYRLNQMSRNDFWRTVVELAGADSETDYAKLEELWAQSYQLNTDVVDILKRYRNAGMKIGLVSNSDTYRKQYMDEVQGQKEFLDYSVVSCEVGELKPDQAIFSKAAEIAATDAANILYFDDRYTHAESAASVGMEAKVFSDVGQFEQDINNFYRGIAAWKIRCDTTLDGV